jgi:hypothetical protein
MKYFIVALFLLFSKSMLAQPGREITYGFYIGGISSKMSDLPDVIIRKGIYKNYNLNDEGRYGFIGGGFLNWKYPFANISIQPEVYYSKQGTNLNYDDIKGLNYKMSFNYSYINTGVLLKYYPFGDFYIGAGPYLGLNIDRDNITYSSNGEALMASSGVFFEPDVVVQKILKESLKGNDYFYFMLGMGYEFKNKIMVGFRYNLGITDALETQENGQRYTENKNKIDSFSINIGYIFKFDDSKNF